MSFCEDLTRVVTESSPQMMVLACENETAIGSAYGTGDRERDNIGFLNGIWVLPASRRQGLDISIIEGIFSGRVHSLWAPLNYGRPSTNQVRSPHTKNSGSQQRDNATHFPKILPCRFSKYEQICNRRIMAPTVFGVYAQPEISIQTVNNHPS